MINARSETVASKRAFAESFERRRCLIPADGFYEWEKAGGRKLPWFVHRTDGDPMVFAGIWSSWRDPSAPDERRLTCSVLTTTANGVLEPIHDRMPVVLDRDVWDLWLDPDADAGDLSELLGPAPSADVERYRVSTRANSVANNDPTLVEPVADEEQDGLVGPGHPAVSGTSAGSPSSTIEDGTSDGPEQGSLFG